MTGASQPPLAPAGVALTPVSPPEVHLYAYCVMEGGLGRRLGHDLRIVVRDVHCRVALVGGHVTYLEADIDPWHVAVDCAVTGTREDRDVLTAEDRARINKAIHERVLRADEHPRIRFASTRVVAQRDDMDVIGKLDLCGQSHPLHFPLVRNGHQFAGTSTLHLRDYGIEPFSKWLGMYRVNPDLKLAVTLPADMGPHEYRAGVKPV